MIFRFARYSRGRSLGVLTASKMFAIVMAADSRLSLPMIAIPLFRTSGARRDGHLHRRRFSLRRS